MKQTKTKEIIKELKEKLAAYKQKRFSTFMDDYFNLKYVKEEMERRIKEESEQKALMMAGIVTKKQLKAIIKKAIAQDRKRKKLENEKY